jgi:hypothetical protein
MKKRRKREEIDEKRRRRRKEGWELVGSAEAEEGNEGNHCSFYTECPRRKGQYSGRSLYLSF